MFNLINRLRAGRVVRLYFLVIILALGIVYAVSAIIAGMKAEGTGNRVAFFSDVSYGEENKRVIGFFSDVRITETGAVNGNIYAFFSRVYLHDGARVDGKLYIFSSEVFGADASALTVKIPIYILRAIFVLAGALLCFAAYAFIGGFVEQGGVLLGAEPANTIRNGILAYFLTVALTLILLLTIVLLPIALLFIIVGFLLIVVGQASMAMMIGLIVARRLNKRFTPVACLFIGLGALAVITNIPFIGAGVGYVFMPMLSMGITVTCAINGLIRKKFYYPPFKKADVPEPKDFDRTAIRGVITGKRG